MRGPTAVWLAIGVAAALAAARADDKNYALRFDPPAITAGVGEPAKFTINYTRDGAPRESAPADYKVVVRPREGATVRPEGNGFVFVAVKAGVYEIYAEHDSDRARFGARGSLWAKVVEAAPAGIAAIAVGRSSDRAAIGGNVPLPLVVGRGERVEAVALDAQNRPLGVELSWSTDSTKLRLTRIALNQFEVTVLAPPVPGERVSFAVTAAGGPTVVVTCQVTRADPGPATAGIVLSRAENRERIDPAAEIRLAPGETLALRAEHLDASGQPVRGSSMRFGLDPAAIGSVTPGHWNSVTITAAANVQGVRGRLIVEVLGTNLRLEQAILVALPAPRGAARVVLERTDGGPPLGAGPLVLAPGERAAVRAIGFDERGTALEGWLPRWEMNNEAGTVAPDGVRCVVTAGNAPGRYTLAAVCPGTGVIGQVSLEVRAPEPAMPGPRLARVSIVDAQSGEPVRGDQAFRPGDRLTFKVIGLDRRGRPVELTDVRWTLSHRQAGKLWQIDALTVRLDVAREQSADLFEIVAQVPNTDVVDRLRFRVGAGAPPPVPVPTPVPACERAQLVVQIGQEWMAVDPNQPLFLTQGAVLVLRVVGYDRGGREVAAAARFEAPGCGVEQLDPATVRVRLTPGTGAVVVTSVQGLAQPLALVVVMP